MIFEMLRDMILETTGCDEGDITPSAELREDLGLTGGDLAEILEAMAAELGFRPEDIAPDTVTTTRDLVARIADLL